ncbi:MAG: RtcB family protein, partial [Myxococcota bacterium]
MSSAPVRSWSAEPLSDQVNRALERLARTEGVVAVAAMPDVHLASEVCVGTVLATEGLIFPAAVGGCIGCGMSAVAFNADRGVLGDPSAAARVLGGLNQRVPILKHQAPQTLSEDLQSQHLSAESLERKKERDGRYQIGTLGRGNHFLEFQRDEDDRLWLMVHSGSRGMGQAIRDHHVTGARETRTGLRALEAASTWAMSFKYALPRV